MDERWMREAIRVAEEAIANGQTPFGCAIVRDGQVLARGHNEVWLRTDITAHAEVVALQRACQAAREVHLRGATVYTTTEPCPMCMAACHWANVDRVVFGARIPDALRAGFRELTIGAEDMVRLGKSSVHVQGGVLAAECAALFPKWQAAGRAKPY
ncbi:MAG: nucleoside deaminase [Halobacteriales archaeon]|nr:nucleoside deaminase [Halobacteriales archaeon]